MRKYPYSWAMPRLMETIACGLSGLKNSDYGQRLDAGDAIGAVVVARKGRYTVTFRHPDECDDQFHWRAGQRRAIAILTKDWRAEVDEYYRLREVEKEAVELREREIVRSAQMVELIRQIDAIAARLDAFEAAQQGSIHDDRQAC
jgi:hypothetical protein